MSALEQQLYDQLFTWRKSVASSENMAPFNVYVCVPRGLPESACLKVVVVCVRGVCWVGGVVGVYLGARGLDGRIRSPVVLLLHASKHEVCGVSLWPALH
jgi:hypothetical protein